MVLDTSALLAILLGEAAAPLQGNDFSKTDAALVQLLT